MTTKITGKRNLLFPIICILVVLAAGLLAYSFFGGLGEPAIPASAQVGIKPGSARILGYFQLNDWAEGVSSTAKLTIFETRLTGTGENETRVFMNDGQSARYVGALSDQLHLPGVQALFIDFGSQRCIIGRVSPEIRGKLLYFRIERPEADKRRWMEGVKESTIEKNLFIVPIKAGDQPNLWNFVVLAAVQTKESLQRGFDQKGSYFQVERSYSPPLDVSGFNIPISIQK
jgi:hypothetical protein